jgi:uncharacterized protein
MVMARVPGQRLDRARVRRLEGLVRSSPWMLAVLRAVRDCDPPDWWVGGGVLRDLVWDELHGGFDPALVKDVDVAFHDPVDLRPERDQVVERALTERLPGIRWDAKNQAAVHTWYQDRFGRVVAPLASALDGVATWPETATAVAVRLEPDGSLSVAACCGLDDLLGGIYRRNPRRVTVAEYRRRLAAKRVAERWPRVLVIDG